MSEALKRFKLIKFYEKLKKQGILSLKRQVANVCGKIAGENKRKKA
ncbi:MAG TPA: hypothetical protein VIO15_06385 [Bacteroidales bacterium]